MKDERDSVSTFVARKKFDRKPFFCEDQILMPE